MIGSGGGSTEKIFGVGATVRKASSTVAWAIRLTATPGPQARRERRLGAGPEGRFPVSLSTLGGTDRPVEATHHTPDRL